VQQSVQYPTPTQSREIRQSRPLTLAGRVRDKRSCYEPGRSPDGGVQEELQADIQDRVKEFLQKVFKTRDKKKYSAKFIIERRKNS